MDIITAKQPQIFAGFQLGLIKANPCTEQFKWIRIVNGVPRQLVYGEQTLAKVSITAVFDFVENFIEWWPHESFSETLDAQS